MTTLWQQVRPHWMPRDVALLVSARVLMSVTRALAGVLVPIYLVELGFDAFQLGVLFAVVGLTSALMSASVGLFADQVGRKVFLVAVPLLTAAAAIVFAYNHVTAVLFVSAALGAFGRGAGAGGGTVGPYQPAEQAFVADATPARHRNSVFGRLAFSSALGAALGGQLARIPEIARGLGAQGLAPYQAGFIVMAAFATGAALLALPVREVHRSRPPRDPASPRPVARRVAFPRRSRPLLYRLWITNGLNGMAVGLFGPFITYWFYTRYGVGPGTIGLLYSVMNLASLFSNLSAASIARRLGLVRSVFVGRLVQATLLTAMALAPTFWMAGGIYLVRMLAQRVAAPLRQSYTMGLADPEERAAVAGLARLPSQGTSSLSQLGAGYLFAHVALELPFLIGSALQVVNAVVYFALFRGMPPPEEIEARAAAATRADAAPGEPPPAAPVGPGASAED
jgi:MFS family permease